MQICQIISPPVTALFCFLSYILSSPHGNRTLLWKQDGSVEEERRWVVFFCLICPAVASGSLFAFCLGFDKLNCLSSILFSGSSAEMHLKIAQSSWCLKPQTSILIWGPVIFPMEGRKAPFSLYSLLWTTRFPGIELAKKSSKLK